MHTKTVLALLLCLGLIAAYARTQERITYRNGTPYDAETYWHQARLVENQYPVKNWAPFVYRLATPFVVGAYYPQLANWLQEDVPALAHALASIGPKAGSDLDPNDLLDGFTWLGFLSGLGTILLLYGIFRTYSIAAHIAWLLIAIYIANPNSPFRFSPYYPAFADPFAFTFFWCLFLQYKRGGGLSTLAICIVSFVGALAREVIIAVPLTFLGAFLLEYLLGKRSLSLRPTIYRILPILAAVAGVVATRHLVEHIPLEDRAREYTTLGHFRVILEKNFNHPSIFALCLFTSLGPFVIWLTTGLLSKRLRSFLADHTELLLFLPGMLCLSAIGGYHTDRFVFWALPGTLILLGFMIQNRVALPQLSPLRWIYLGALMVTTMLTYRVFHSLPDVSNNTLIVPGTPDHLLFAAYGPSTTWGQLTAAAMEPWSRLILLTQFAGLSLFLVFLSYIDHVWTRWSKARSTNTSHPSVAS